MSSSTNRTGAWGSGLRRVGAICAAAAVLALSWGRAGAAGQAAGAPTAGPAATGAGAAAVMGPADYSATWNGVAVALARIRARAPRGSAVGRVTDFQTNDPGFTCFAGQSMEVYAHQPGLPAADLMAYAPATACARHRAGAWIFTVVTESLTLRARSAAIGWQYVCRSDHRGEACRWVNRGRTSHLTVRLLLDGAPWAGVLVTISGAPAGTRLGAGACTTGASGTCAVPFTVYSAPASTTTYTLLASAAGLADSAPVTYGVRAAAAGVTVRVSSRPRDLGWSYVCRSGYCEWLYLGNKARLTATVYRDGRPAAGVPVTFAASARGIGFAPGRCVTGPRGSCTVTVDVVAAPRKSTGYRLVAIAAGRRGAAEVRYGVRGPATPRPPVVPTT